MYTAPHTFFLKALRINTALNAQKKRGRSLTQKFTILKQSANEELSTCANICAELKRENRTSCEECSKNDNEQDMMRKYIENAQKETENEN